MTMEELVQFLNYHTELYNKGCPSISDREWDEKYFELVKMERDSGIIFPNSPTQNIHYETVTGLKKVEHDHKMLSLDKIKDNWNKFLSYFDSQHAVVGMLKMDGLTCSLRYENGNLVSAQTRGDGIIGEDITHNAKVIPSIPKRIDYKDTLIVDGEIICRECDFEPFKNDYKNPRNFASGSIRLLDSRECAKRNLTFVSWNIVEGFKEEDSLIVCFEKLSALGFIIVPWTSSFDLDAKEFLIQNAHSLSYPIDGLVGRYDSRSYSESLGYTSHHPRGAFAFKFYDEEYTSKLIDVVYDTSRNGILTPVGIFEPIDTGDSIVTKASLHNISVMKEVLNGSPWRGQPITIIKSNEIIPMITYGEPAKDNAEIIQLPENCPFCGEPLALATDFLTCPNNNCLCRIINYIEYFGSKKCLDIKGLSKATIEKLMNWGWVETPLDIFKLHEHRLEWIKRPGFGVKSVDNILNSINNARTTTLPQFIASLGIPFIGINVAKELVKHIKTYEEFRQKIDERFDFSVYDGFAESKTNALLNFDYTLADEIYKFLTIKPVEGNNEELQINVCITGSLKIYKNREELKAAIESRGGTVKDSVSSKTNILINNDVNSTSSKNKKAKELNIPILTEQEFIDQYLK